MIFVGLFVGHLLFEPVYQLAQGEGDAQVDSAYDNQRFQLQVGCAGNDFVRGHQVAQEEGGCQGGLSLSLITLSTMNVNTSTVITV